MKVMERKATRRHLLLGGAAAAVTWAARPVAKWALAQEAASGIVAVKVAQVPKEPDDAAWGQAKASVITLAPQNIALPRVTEAGAKSIGVRALYDVDRVGLLLEWADAHKNTEMGTVLQYRDAVAVQLPEDSETPPPFFTMGQAGRAVTIYHWKSDWQFGRLYDVDEAHPNMYFDMYQYSGVAAGEMPEASDYLTKGRREYLTAAAAGNALADPKAQETIGPVQKMRAEGFGTIEPAPTQDGIGKGLFLEGGWRIVISVPRKQAQYTLADGGVIPLAFAVWDGSRNERNGQKAYSLWNTLNLGELRAAGAPGGVSWTAVGSVAGIIVASAAAVIGLRLWRTKRRQSA